MGEEQVGLSITREDLAQLAQVNPLAWEQLLHIADMRIANEKISFLENRIRDLGDDLEESESVDLNGYKISELVKP
jgi:hypothetical protein